LPSTAVYVDGNDARRTREMTSMIFMAQAACNNKKNSTDKLHFCLRKELVNCYVWSIALCGAEIWTFREVDQT